MIKIAIIDDEEAEREKVKSFLARYQMETQANLEVLAFQDALEFLDEFDYSYQLVFLDIQMPMMNGMEAARKIREKDSNIGIIFLTNLANYAIEGYQVNALDYCLKPINYEEFKFKLLKAFHLLELNPIRQVLINTHGQLKQVLVSDILYVEVRLHILIIHCNGETLSKYEPLSKFENQLPAGVFARCNNCYLVNLNHVKQIKELTCFLDNGEGLQISRTRKLTFMNALKEHHEKYA